MIFKCILIVLPVIGAYLGLLWYGAEITNLRIAIIHLEHKLANISNREPRNVDQVIEEESI
jgi:uncharacterized membrane protein